MSLTAQQPLNNIVRTTTEALSAVLGGTQSLHTNPYDEALALPTEGAARVALRTQQVIAHETGVTSTTDPLGGSYFVEALTDRMEEAAYAYFAKIDELGGMVEAIKQNYPQREIADASFRLQQEIERGERIIVGVNRHQHEEDGHTEILRIPAGLERKQIDRVQALRARRDGAAAETALAELRGGRGRPQPDGAAARLRPCRCQRRRDRGIAPAGVRHLHRNTRLLKCPCAASESCSSRRHRAPPPRGRGRADQPGPCLPCIHYPARRGVTQTEPGGQPGLVLGVVGRPGVG